MVGHHQGLKVGADQIVESTQAGLLTKLIFVLNASGSSEELHTGIYAVTLEDLDQLFSK